jgi:hypothetical protein
VTKGVISASRSEIEVVVTPPEPFRAGFASQFGMRTTLGVLIELLASARDHVAIAAPFSQGAEALHAKVRYAWR